MLTLVVGAAVGVGLKPRGTLLAGVLVLLLGMAMSATGFWFGFILFYKLRTVVIALGAGIAMPALLAAATTDLYGRREGLRSASLALVIAAMGAGVGIGYVIGYSLAERAGAGIVGLLCLVAMLVTLLLVGGLVFLGRGSERLLPPPPFQASRAAVSAGVIAALALPLGLTSLAMRYWLYAYSYQGALLLEAHLHEAITVAAALLSFGIGLLLYRLKPAFPSLVLAGVGLILCGLGVAINALPPGFMFNERRLFLLVSLVPISGGVALAVIFGLSRALGDLPPKLATAMAALFLLVMGVTEGLVGWIERGLEQRWLADIVPWVAAAVALLAGLVLAIAAIPLHRRVYAHPQSD